MVHLRLLGGASLIGPEGPAAGRGAQRRRLALLALLAVSRKPISRERLLGLLWPDAETERARKLLSESLYVLRKEIHEDVFRASGDELRLDPLHVTCDVGEFEDALARGDARAAVDLYGGPLLEGFFVEDAEEFERWVDGERDRLERRYREALEGLARDAATPRDAAPWWRRLAERDPYDARVAAALMNALVAAGDRAAALQHARVHEQRLRDDLGAALEPDIVALVDRIRSGSAATPIADAPAARATAPIAPAHAFPPDFRIERRLGAGSTADVYLGRELPLDRAVTIKVLKPEVAADPSSRVRFEREARAAANITHPNVANVFRYGVLADGAPYLVSRYVKGRTLEEVLAAEGPMDVATVRRILAEIAAALEAAHRLGVVHRDIRPGNIFIDDVNRQAIVSDFGIAAMTESWAHGEEAKITRTGQILGDPRYVSPEQFRGEHVSETTDIYSTGIVGYEMLTGRRPHADAGARVAAVARLTAEPIELPVQLLDADPALADLLTRCLAADPRHRPSAAAIVQRLRTPSSPASAAIGGALLPPQIARLWRTLTRRKLPQWVAAVAAFGVVVIGLTADMDDEAWMPDAALETVLSTVVAAVVASGVLAWFHGERGEQRMRPTEVALLLLILVAWIAALIAIF